MGWVWNPQIHRASSIYKFDGIIVSFNISRYGEPKTLGEFIRRRRFGNDLFAKELAKLIGVTQDTIINWEKGRTYPSQRRIILLKEHLDIDPFELIEFDGAISERQKSIPNLITERGPITGRECQDLLGLRQQYAQNDLFHIPDTGYDLYFCLKIANSYADNTRIGCPNSFG